MISWLHTVVIGSYYKIKIKSNSISSHMILKEKLLINQKKTIKDKVNMWCQTSRSTHNAA
jgi:hypothetical protein